MYIIQRVVLYQFSFMLILLIVTSGCQTADNIITPEPSVASLQSNKEATTTEKSAEIDKKSLIELQKDLVSRWSGLMGHGGVPQSNLAEEEKTATTKKSADKVIGKSDEIEKGSFVELEKNVVGKWLNLKETESLEFLDDGTILIGTEDSSRSRVRGYYKFVDKDRLKVHFGKGFYNKLLPPMSFKISISENEITLTDEPDGAATTYKRIK